MSNKKKTNKRRHRSPWFKMFAKTDTRLSARVTREEDWQTDVPNIRLSRAFVIVLVMHFVVIGAVTAFTMMNPHDAKGTAKPGGEAGLPDTVAAVGDKVESPPENRAEGAPEKPSEPVADAGGKPEGGAGAQTPPAGDRLDDMRRHIVHSGDSVTTIAQQYGVTPAEIYAVNRIDELYQLYQGRVLRIPVSPSAVLPLNPRMVDRPSGNGSNAVSNPGSRTTVTAPRDELVPSVEISSDSLHKPVDQSLLPQPAAEVSRLVVEEESIPEPDLDPEPEQIVVEDVRTPEEIRRPAPAPAAAAAPEAPRASKQKQYTVVKGDNPFRIAQKFGVHFNDLLSHNGISDPSKLQIGQTLNIPN